MLQKIYKQFQGSPFRVGGSAQHERNMEREIRLTHHGFPERPLHGPSNDLIDLRVCEAETNFRQRIGFRIIDPRGERAVIRDPFL